MSKEITAIMLQTTAEAPRRLHVSVEIGGKWVVAINEYYDGDHNISHIVERPGIDGCEVGKNN